MAPRRILATGFGAGLHFLAARQAWREDPRRPPLLHYVAIEPVPPVAVDPELAPRLWGIGPGFHRIAFDDGRVLLTLCVGELRGVLQELALAADEVVVPGEADLFTLKAVGRLCGRGATLSVGSASERDLHEAGFVDGRFDPSWQLRHPRTSRHPREGGDPVMTGFPPPRERRAVVVGGGIAGAAVAASLARREWQVEVLDAAPQPAAGASGLPAGLLAPHTSPDDNLLSRLSRAGVRMTLDEAAARLQPGEDFERTGSIEKREGGDFHHEAAAWIRPAALVREWLASPGAQWRGNARVAKLERGDVGWCVLDARGEPLAHADLVVLAAAVDGAALHPALPLRPVRGQVSWAPLQGQPVAATPLNGNGHFLPRVPVEGVPAWLTGSTYGRGETSLAPRAEDQQANLDRLRQLAPEIAAALAPAFERGEVHAWTGIRCASPDRRPLVGELEEGLWVSTAMGSRGLTFALLCAELLAARLHGEPLPLPAKLAASLDVARLANLRSG